MQGSPVSRWGHSLPRPQPQAHLSEREVRELKRKQANRDSARRSKMRKKEEDEAMLTHAQQLHASREVLLQQLSAAKERIAQLTQLHLELLERCARQGLQLPAPNSSYL
ncbi:hypothetical protein V8C86DRAFT_2484437 [Haematococcus lacustris]